MSNHFATITPPSGTSPVADAATDTLSLTTTAGCVTLSGTSSTDTIDATLTLPTKRIFLSTDFFGFPSRHFNAFTNAATDYAPELVSSTFYQGLNRITSGTVAGILGSYRTGFNAIRLGAGVTTYNCVFKTPSALSDVTDDYEMHMGFYNAESAITDGVYFYYNYASSTKWLARTEKDDTITATDTGITFAVDTWYNVKIVVNAAASSVAFYINGSLVATNTTNIPGSGDPVGVGVNIYRVTTGVTSRLAYVDLLTAEIILTTSR